MLSIYCKYAKKIPLTEIPQIYQKIPEKIPGKYQKPKKNRLQTATVYIEKYQKIPENTKKIPKKIPRTSHTSKANDPR